MINFQPVSLEHKTLYNKYLFEDNNRSCEFSFANIYLWGQQNLAFLHDHVLLLSHFGEYTVYPYPIGSGDKKTVLDAIIADAKEREIPCCLSGLRKEDIDTVELLYPGRFRTHCNRDSFDYVYSIEDLADLKGRKYHRKRNHISRFQSVFPKYTTEPLTTKNIALAKQLAEEWYHTKLSDKPDNDFSMEQAALNMALLHYEELDMEGLLLRNQEEILAFTLGSYLSSDTFDIHFEKAKPGFENAYPVMNNEFAKHIHRKYSEIKFLDREEDMGIEGLRKAKESYYPHHMKEKCRALLMEESHENN